MSDSAEAAPALVAPDALAETAAPGLTPTGTQSTQTLFRRRLLVAFLNVATFVLVTLVFAQLAGHGGWTPLDACLLVAFMISTPWTILGLWNAVIGLWLLHGGPDAAREVFPYALKAHDTDPVTARTAILLTLRNEDPERALLRLRLIKQGLEAAGAGGHFAYFVLSDSTQPDVIAAEETAFARWVAENSSAVLHYRRRTTNAGFKAGNIRDFLERWGDGFDLMIGLDADSLMGAKSILRLVRIMQANPRLGILQSLVVGLPAASAFARIFQFGMRHGMRSYTMGASWWAGDCGPYWGHNAVVRVAPFKAHCTLPVLPGKPPLGGDILSHDQIEAAFMRRAGYEVRVLPEETESYEENPPHLREFTRRDLRWCQGNMQYWRLLLAPGLKPLSRFQIAWAILMYLGAFGWMVFVVVATLAVFESKQTSEPYPAALGLGLFIAMFVMNLMPKLAGLADILLQKGGAARYGGAGRLLLGALAELVFSMLVSPVIALRIAIFMVGLPFGKTVVWDAQARDAERLSWRTAFSGLWPQLVFGIILFAVLAIRLPGSLWFALPMLVGLVLAAPLAVVTADPRFGRWCGRIGLCATPEEIAPPDDVAALFPDMQRGV